MRERFAAWTFLLSLLALAPAALGCNVPVFRYALEAWTPAPYEMFVFHRGKMSDTDRGLLDALRKNADDEKAPVNITFTDVDVSEKMEERLQKLWAEQKDAALPRAVLVYPSSDDAFWSGALSADLLPKLSASPARTEIAKRLANGDSVVFVVLESGKKDADAAAETLLAKELAGLQATMKLPRQDDEDDEFTPRRRQLNIPLKVSFSTLKITHGDAKEAKFIDLLMKTDKKLSAGEPIVFPVFGRGRLLCALTGPTIGSANLAECTTFLSGACSCQVKELNPGVDLLMNVNWDTLLEDAVQTAAKSTGNVAGAVVKSKTESENHVPNPLTSNRPSPEILSAAPESKPSGENEGSSKLLWAGIVAASILVVVTGIRAVKSRNA